MDSGTFIQCNVTVENLNTSLEVAKRQSHRGGELSLWRNEHKEIVLGVKSKGKNQSLQKFVVRDVKFFCKFLKEGKVSLHLTNHNVRLMLANCPPETLKNFCKILSVKLTGEKKKGEMSLRKKLLLGLPKSLEEISPLNQNDIAKVNEIRADKENKENAKMKDNKKGNFVNRKRKLPLQDRTNEKQNNENVQNPPKRRMLSLSTERLSKEQKRVLSAVKNKFNIFFTGSAGTGKSFLLRYIVGMLPPTHTFVTASTGVAACQIGGMTLHSFAGMGRATGSLQQCIEFVINRPNVLKQWKKCHHLIIDEISMIDGEFFDKMEAIARVAKKNSEPFGGIQLILCGDFFQLPPVSKGSDTKKLCFQAKSWEKCVTKCIELKQVYRQTDPTFVRILQDIRIGRCTEISSTTLQNTYCNRLEQNGILATRLCTHREDVDHTNKSQLEKLPGVICSYKSEDNSSSYSSILDNALPDTRTISLKLGAQVMLTKNLDVSRGLVNGARGVITGFTNSKNHSMKLTKQQLLAGSDSEPQNLGFPIVRFMSGVETEIKHERWSMKLSQEILAVRKQIPLKLAWAISIHKSQGMSLDCVEMCLSRVFECGQAYVALSRARSLRGLRVIDFTSSCVRSNLEALRFYRRLRQEQTAEESMELIPLGC